MSDSTSYKSSQALAYSAIPHNSFDLLRLVFAGIVVIAHGMYLSGEEIFTSCIPYFDTTVAVMGFFVLSGYLILSSYLRQPQWQVYYKKRALRLLPAYIMIVLCCALLLSTVSTLGMLEYFSDTKWWKYVGYNLVFLNFLQPTLPGVFEQNPMDQAVNGSLWTIKIEVAFYISIPILVYVFRTVRKSIYIKAILLLMYLFSIVYEWKVLELTLSHPQYTSLLNQFPAMLQYFSVGMWAYLFIPYQWFKQPLTWVIGGLLFLERFVLETTFLWPIGLGILIFCVGFGLKDFAQRLLRGNDYSYGIYILHYPIAQLYTHWGIFKWSAIGGFIIFLITVIILSVLSWHLLEKRFLKKKAVSK